AYLTNAEFDQSVEFDLSELTSNDEDSIIVTLTGVTVADLADVEIADVLINEYRNANDELIEPSWLTQIEPLVKDEIKPVIVVDLSDETRIDTIVQGGQDEENEPLAEVFLGSAADDRVIANGGQDIFSNFAAADTFLGGTTGIVQIKQSNYLHAKDSGSDYLHIEQITAADLNEAIGPQMAGYEAVVDTTPGLRLIDNVVNPLTGEQTVNTGFAQVGRIQLISDAGLIADTMDIKEITAAGEDVFGLQLSNQAHRLLAGMGDDVILGGSNTDVIVGNGGNDWLGGGAGNDILAAGSGAIASSGSDPDNIFGYVGSDYVSTLVGGKGDDTLVAIEGAVIATGSEGSDVFALYGAQAGLQTHLTITDFEIG
ncbi:MAG: hypothetical protein EBQ98_04925, partial [Actinobacteria bacterium]|nr:hypothetical protein [Actinomycetota bacterium]